MRPGDYDITIKQGATWTFAFRILTGDEDSEPMDLTDGVATLQIREKIISEEPALNISTTTGEISLGDELGTVAITVEAETTADLDFGSGSHWDIRIELADERVIYPLEGTATLVPWITRTEAP